MKKIYVWLLVTAGFVLSASAQPFQKGDKLLGGSIYLSHVDNSSFYNLSQSDSKYTTVGFSPAIGIFTKQNQLTGILLSYQHSISSASSNPQMKSNNYSAGVYRQYWNTLGKNFNFIIQGQLLANYGYTSYDAVGPAGNTKRDQKSYGTYFSIDPGFAYRIKKKLVLDLYYSNFLRTGYTYYKENTSNPGTTTSTFKGSSFLVDAGLRNFSFDSFRFGFRYLL